MPAKLDSCVEQVMAQGHDESSAYAICNDALSGGSSPRAQWARGLMSMSGSQSQAQYGAFPPKPEAQQKPPEAEVEGIKLTPEQGTKVAQALINVQEAITTGEVTPEVQQDLDDAIAIMEEVANLEESPDAAKPPPPKPSM
jgi:hypothetical protein